MRLVEGRGPNPDMPAEVSRAGKKTSLRSMYRKMTGDSASIFPTLSRTYSTMLALCVSGPILKKNCYARSSGVSARRAVQAGTGAHSKTYIAIPQGRTDTSPSIPRSFGHRAGAEVWRCRSAPRTCTTWPRRASAPIGSTRKASTVRTSTIGASRGCVNSFEWQHDLQDPGDFLSTLKIDLYPEEVYVFTPGRQARGDAA